MTTASMLEQGRESFGRQAWADAYTCLTAVDQEAPLEPEDLERLAIAAYLIGSDVESADVWARAHQELLSRGNVERAVRCGFWVAFQLLNRGEHARGSGWVARARRLLDECRDDCVEQGYLLLPTALERTFAGDNEGAYATFGRAAEIGARFRDRDLMIFAWHGQGRALIRMGRIAEGVTLLDEAMVGIEARETSPAFAGNVYCSVIEACHEVFDVRRAQEWTAALSNWCESQPDMVPYRGQCLVHRAELMQLHGAWRDAMSEAERACEWLSRPPPQRAVGAAYYQQAELYRLRGEVATAEEAYREASKWGRKPQPGLAQLRLAQGQVEAAEAAIRRAVDEAQSPRIRSRLLPAHVDIMLAVSDVQAARASADELAEIAAGMDAPFLRAVSAQAMGAVRLAEGDARSALDALREAWTAWQEIEAPYEAARVQVLIGLACRTLGDEDTAEMEIDAARQVFDELGAAPELTRIEDLSRKSGPGAAGGLTAREMEVLRLVAAGKTNRAIATDLFISEKTVARHVSNIFLKLGLSTRAAATAYAYQHDLV